MTKYQKSLNAKIADLTAELAEDWSLRAYGRPILSRADRVAKIRELNRLREKLSVTYHNA